MEKLLQQLSDQYRNKYYGKYRGFVTDNEDPQQSGRVRLLVPSVLGKGQTTWALPCLPFGGLTDQGLFTVPEIDAQVWVEFEEGNIDHPIWTGTFWQKQGDPPAEAAQSPPTTRVFKTPAGHVLQFDDKDGNEKFRLTHPGGAEITIDANGTIVAHDARENSLTLDADAGKIVLKDDSGNTLTMDAGGTILEDANGNVLKMDPSGIKVKGQQIVLEGTRIMLGGQGGEPVIKGQSFLTLFATHVHPSAMGPTGPPIPQGEMSTLSMKVTTS